MSDALSTFGLSLQLAAPILTNSHSSFEYDGTSNRWKNVRLPITGSTVVAAGAFQDVSGDGDGEPVLNLLDISYGIPETVVASPTRTIGHRKAPR